MSAANRAARTRSGRGVGARSGTRRAAIAEFKARVLQERRIAGTVGDGSSAAVTAERWRRRPGGRPERSRAHRRERAQRHAGLRGPRYVLRPDASGRVARFPRAPGHADPAEGAERPEPLGEARLTRLAGLADPTLGRATRRPIAWRRLRRARHPAGRSGGPGHSTAGAST